ncbi:MAG: DEAD/DEAH box helicase, partial [Candidatus Brocadiia bacterium]
MTDETHSPPSIDVDVLLERLRDDGFYAGQIILRRDEPAIPPRYAQSDEPRTEVERAVRLALGVNRLYTHQTRALEAVREGQDVVLHGGAAGGKSLAFQVPAVERALRQPPGATMVLCPYKPVAHAQRRKLERIARHAPGLSEAVTVYDGDLSPSLRRHRRGRPLLITNPDMLHRGILPNHPRWAEYFSRLRMVVLEELHSYSGLFGANVACLMRRLWRVCGHYASQPQLVCTTSTLANPAEHAERLTGRTARVIASDGAPRGARTWLLWRPLTAAPSVEAGRLVAELAEAGHGAIAFSRGRVACELIAEYARRRLRDQGRPADTVAVYRGGHRPEELRGVEERLHDGDVQAVATTNLLELGLDVPSLDAAVLCGWPGSVAAFRQQAARAGRAGQASLVILVSLEDPVNNFLMAHPEYIFERDSGPGVVERDNPHVTAGHLRCAAQELPLCAEDAERISPRAQEALPVLEDRRKLYHRDGLWYHAASEQPARELPLRGYAGRNVLVMDVSADRVIAEVDWVGAHRAVYPQAIYLHDGRTYLVRDFDREKRHAYAEPVEVDYYTVPLDHTFVESVDECLRERALAGGTVFFGEVTAGSITTGLQQRRFGSNELIRSIGIELPPVTYETMGLWLCLSAEREAELSALGLTPEFYGLGNALRIVLPAFMTCDVLDLAPWSGQTNFPWTSLYVYERYRRGLGFTERMFEAADEVLGAVWRNLCDCTCEDGCPLCVGDPVRPFMITNPELEADLIPSRAEVRLALECLRREAPVEELLVEVFGVDRVEELLAGRRELLDRRRAEAAEAPARMLPTDTPADGASPRVRLPLQTERGVRRRIERMRTAEQKGPFKPVRRAAVPAPEEQETLPTPDPASRRGVE